MSNIKFISVDFQNDFSSKDGLAYVFRPSVDFVKNIFVPFLRDEGIKVAEIVSDYRQPRPGDSGDCCHPGEWGFESEIPDDIKLEKAWVKCMNSPIWVRENGGVAGKIPGVPFQDASGFGEWLEEVVGSPKDVEIVLFGLTVDCCVLCTAQELCWRGYKVRILEEAVDTYSGDKEEKEWVINNPPLINWAKVVSWKELQSRL